MKLTRHNGRSGKHGTYNPRHNDRRFDVENSEHIDADRARQNIYWDCYRGFTTHEFRENPEQPDFSFEEIERMFYYEHYGGHVEAQNARNEKTRHTERNRTVEDLLKNNKTCPEETLYQIGTMEQSVPPEVLFQIVTEFQEEFDRRFGSHVHIIDWALHLDEATPHIHERHVFDCENRYGELCPQQEKALEELGVPLPKPDKPKGRNNNRKQTFDAICRTLLFDICRRHGLHLDQEPSYGGRDYLEKQDYILMKQKEQLAAQEQKLEELTLKIEDVETLLDDVSDVAYDKAVEVVTDKVREQTQLEDLKVIEDYRKNVTSPKAKNSPEVVRLANTILGRVRERLLQSAGKILKTVQTALMQPEVKQAGKEQIKKKAKESIMDKLAKAKINTARENRERWEREGRIAPTKKQDMEL
ncbi:plasmid recombination protein [[Bacteroides] pectinophilus]|nr:plasmid recombination protein [[Bacteroides] pectinophilus]